MAFGFGDADIDDHADHLTAYWKMEETGAADRIDSVGANDAAPTNSPGTRTGINNLACDFPQTGEFLTVADSADVSPTTGFAASMWLYLDTIPSNEGIFEKDQSYRFLNFSSADKLFFDFYQSDTTGKTVKSVVIGTGAWVHAVIMAAGGFGRMFLDGSEVGTAVAYDNTIRDNSNNLYIGTLQGSGAWEFDGGIDEVGFWKNITFADQTEREAFVTALYNSGTGRFYHDLSVPVYLERDVNAVLERDASAILLRTDP